LEDDHEKISNLIRRRLPIDLTEVKHENKENDLEISLPESTFLIEGIQIIKRGISTDIFKFIPSLKSVIFVEKYTNSAASSEKPSKEENTTSTPDKEAINDTDEKDKKEDIGIEDKTTDVSPKTKKEEP
jgi:peptidylprolyl isomerase